MWRRGLMTINQCHAFQLGNQTRTISNNTTDLFVIHGDLTQLSKGEIPQLGVEAHVRHAFTLEDTTQFAKLTGDSNPIHTDPAFAAKQTGSSTPIVQGMLSSSLFATIFGKTIPGAVYISQSLRWRTPLLIEEEIVAKIRVVRVRKRFVDCETICEKTSDGAIVVEGTATVLLPGKDQV